MEMFDVVVIGAGAAGLMCAIEAGKRGRRVLVLDHAKAPGEKIRISGGGRCNFTNTRTAPAAFLSQNPRFCISALSRYTPADFIALVDRHGIAWHEKTLGQLFCDDSAKQIVDMLVGALRDAGGVLRLGTDVSSIEKAADGFSLMAGSQAIGCQSLVIATGGKSIPKMGATGFAYDVARQFGLAVTTTRPALVPLTIEVAQLARLAPLAGVAADVRVRCGKTSFDEAMLFTHRGLSGPAVLQASSYWQPGETLQIAFAPGTDWHETLSRAKATSRRQLGNELATHLPQRLAQAWLARGGLPGERPLPEVADKPLRQLAESLAAWRIAPNGTEGWKKAEVMAGGVDTREIDSKTLESKRAPGLHFIGEVLDVTGWLGGYNFQWAWASAYACAEALAQTTTSG